MAHATTRRRDIDRTRVREAVEAAERGTSAEIVVAISSFFVGRVWIAACRAFERLGVANTRRRNGVLVFVAPSRHAVVIVPDDGADRRVDAAVWDDVVARIAAAFGRGHGTDGLVDGVRRLGEVLAGPFPLLADDVDELPNEPQQF